MPEKYGRFICIEDGQIQTYAKAHDDKLLGKNYELLAAIVLKNFFRIAYKLKSKIGIKIKPKYSSYYNKDTPLNPEEIRVLLEEHRDEDDPMDFVICPMGMIRSFGENRLEAKAWAFQVKRFGYFQQTRDTSELKAVLTKISKQYAKTKVTLVIFFDGHRGIKIDEIHEHIRKIDFPFREVMFIDTGKNEKDEWKMRVGELWPNKGYNEYEPTDLAKIEK
jgi:hypothetical protein